MTARSRLNPTVSTLAMLLAMTSIRLLWACAPSAEISEPHYGVSVFSEVRNRELGMSVGTDCQSVVPWHGLPIRPTLRRIPWSIRDMDQ